MVQPTNGQLVTENQIGIFEDAAGKPIVFERNKDGTFEGHQVKVPLAFDEKGKVNGEVQYNYGLEQQGKFYQVSVSKQKIFSEDQKEAKLDVMGSAPQGPVSGKDAKEADQQLKERNKESGGKTK